VVFVVVEGEIEMDAEVVARSTAHRPEEVGVLLLAARDPLAVGPDQPGLHQPVAGEPRHLVAESDASAEHEPGDPDTAASTGREDDVAPFKLGMQHAVGDTGLHQQGSRFLRHRARRVADDRRGRAGVIPPDHIRHQREHQQQTAGGREPGVVVAEPAARRDRHAVAHGPADARRDVGRTARRDDRQRADGGELAVERRRELLVPRLAGDQQVVGPGEGTTELLEIGAVTTEGRRLRHRVRHRRGREAQPRADRRTESGAEQCPPVHVDSIPRLNRRRRTREHDRIGRLNLMGCERHPARVCAPGGHPLSDARDT